MNTSTSTLARFWSKVDVRGPTECWPWKASRAHGYGQFSLLPGRNVVASRFAWMVANGRGVTVGMKVLHSCDNPPCCNPAHLREGTQSENIREAHDKKRLTTPQERGVPNQHQDKTHCVNGHELTPENLVRITKRSIAGKRGWRICRLCRVSRGTS